MSSLVLLLAMILGILNEVSAQEKVAATPLLPTDVYFEPAGGVRVRYEKLHNATGESFTNDEDDSRVQQRAQLDFKIYKGEYFETFFRLLHFSEWGNASGNSLSGQKDAFNRDNGLLVNQAWALWKVDDSLGLRFGRGPLDFGLGYVYSQNDWFNVPYSFDFFDIAWDWESLKLSMIYAKVLEMDRVAGQSLSPDPEENHIIINANVKNLYDAIEVFNFNVVQINRDLGSRDGGVTVLNGLNMQKFSLETELNFRNVFSTLFLSYGTGEEKVAPINQINGFEKIRISHTAIDFKLGYRFLSMGGLRLWGGLHTDSGDTVAGDNESQTYNSLFYNVYGQSGLMDLFRWGNLSFYRAGMDIEVTTGWTVGAEWLNLSRTEETDSVQWGSAGRFLSSRLNSNDLTLGTGNELGSEFDLWVDAQFQSGVALRATVSSFFPGEVFKGATTTTGLKPTSSINQFLTQVGYFF